jgi:hypothetical protein
MIGKTWMTGRSHVGAEETTSGTSTRNREKLKQRQGFSLLFLKEQREQRLEFPVLRLVLMHRSIIEHQHLWRVHYSLFLSATALLGFGTTEVLCFENHVCLSGSFIYFCLLLIFSFISDLRACNDFHEIQEKNQSFTLALDR